MGLHSTFSREIWLWRGQASKDFLLEPGMHTRLRASRLALDEANVSWATMQLLDRARENRLDQVGELRLPDLALLAHLQHHGAATPLLDVTVDPLVGLWMAAFASRDGEDALDDKTGLVFAIRRPGYDQEPETSRWLGPLDSRPYWSETEPDIAHSNHRGIRWYRAPDISERLRIQRGSFLLGAIGQDAGAPTSIANLRFEDQRDGRWLEDRVASVGRQARPVRFDPEVVAFRVQGSIKPVLREWLKERAGLSQAVVYPTPWNRPFLEEFCAEYSRPRPIDFVPRSAV